LADFIIFGTQHQEET